MVYKRKNTAMAMTVAIALNCGLVSGAAAAELSAGSVTVTGNKSIANSVILDKITGLEPGQMKEAVTKLYGDAGYKLVRVEVTAGEQTTVAIHEITLDKINITGNKFSKDAAILRALPALKAGAPVNIRELSGQTLLAGENPYRKMTVDFRLTGQDKADAYVTVAEQPSFKTILSVDNTGDSHTGRVRTRLSFLEGNVGGEGHSALFSFGASPDRFGDVKQFGFLYNAPLPRAGDNIYFTATYSDVNSGRILDGGFYNVDAAGKGSGFGLHYVKTLTRQERLKESLSIGFDYNQYKNNSILNFLNVPVPLGVDIDTMPFTLAYRKNILSPGESVNFSLSFVQNLPGGGKNSDSQYNSYRQGARASYNVWRASANHQRLYKNGWLSNISLNAQYANSRLVYPEQMGLGGVYSLRGLNERQLAGDRALRASFELYTPKIARYNRLLAFVDTGYFANNDPLPGELDSGSAVAAGLGWRFNHKGYSLSLDWGYLLNGPDSVDKHKSKVHFVVSKVF